MTVIAHVSDFHLIPVPFPFGEGLKPALGWINWRRKPGAHDNDAGARTIAAVRACAPDHVALTGDLIELGLPAEYAAAGALLARLGEPDRVSWAPGNHDVYTPRAGERLQAVLADWFGPSAGADLRHRFPRLDLVGRAAVVTLCSGTPTWLFSAEGELGTAQLARLDGLLAGLDRTAHLPVIAVHHPPHAPGLSPLKRLRDGAALMALLTLHRCPLVLHGHLHAACEARWQREGQAVSVVGAPSASSAGRHGDDPAGFNLVHVAADLSWRLERRTVA